MDGTERGNNKTVGLTSTIEHTPRTFAIPNRRDRRRVCSERISNDIKSITNKVLTSTYFLPTKTDPLESNQEQPTHDMARFDSRGGIKVSPGPRTSNIQGAHEKTKKRHEVNKNQGSVRHY